MKLLLILAFLLSVPQLFGATHYVDNSATGCGCSGCADTNNGTSETTAWVHAPVMTGCASNCSSYSPAAGDLIILRSGISWTSVAFLWTIPTRGSSGGGSVYYANLYDFGNR